MLPRARPALCLALAMLLAACTQPMAECEAGVADLSRTAEVLPPC